MFTTVSIACIIVSIMLMFCVIPLFALAEHERNRSKAQDRTRGIGCFMGIAGFIGFVVSVVTITALSLK